MNISRLIDEPYVDMVALNERISSITSSGYYKSSCHFKFKGRPVQGVNPLPADGAYVLIEIMALSKSPKEKIILVPASNFEEILLIVKENVQEIEDHILNHLYSRSFIPTGIGCNGMDYFSFTKKSIQDKFSFFLNKEEYQQDFSNYLKNRNILDLCRMYEAKGLVL